MKGTNGTATTEYFQFQDPADERFVYRVNVSFMLSNWQCLFGQGCPGLFGKQSEYVFPDIGCCTKGAWITSKEELARVEERVKLLTDQDLSAKGLAYIRKKGWLIPLPPEPGQEEDPDYVHTKTRVRDGGCVFANRINEGDGKIGCAFVHLGNRLGEPDHFDTMPTVCSQLPLALRPVYDGEDNYLAHELIPWDADHWGGADDDDSHDSWMSWWCVDTPDAYSAGSPLYVRMEKELRRMVGDKAYELLKTYLDGRTPDSAVPMPGSVRNDGRPLLPLYVGNRTPKRTPKR